MRHSSVIDEECNTCPLSDCYPTDSRCPIMRKKAEEKGIVLPEKPADAPVRTRKTNQKRGGIVPMEYQDRAEYQRKYNREYWSRYGRVQLRGIFLKKEDMQLLKSVCLKQGRNLEAEITKVLESMVAKARNTATSLAAVSE